MQKLDQNRTGVWTRFCSYPTSLWLAIAVLPLPAMIGCSGQSASSSVSNTIALSGRLSLASSSSVSNFSHHDLGPSFSVFDGNGLMTGPSAFAVNSYTISCTTMEDPPVTVAAPVASDGTFTVANIPPNAVSCQIVDANNAPVAPIVLKDTTKTDMKGEAQTVSRVQLSSDADFGTISFDPTAGTAGAVISGTLRSALTDAPIMSAVDFSGTYSMGKFDGTLPNGYVSACTASEQSGGNCHGPSEGETVYIKILKGKEFTPDSTCAAAATANTLTGSSTCGGTVGSADKYGILVWQDQASFESCGSKLGFSFDEAKGYGGIDLSTSGINSGVLNWSTTWSGGNIANGWKFDTARSSYAMNDCNPVTVTGSDSTVMNGWKCHDSLHDTYNIGLNSGGCVDASGTPVRDINWSTVSFGSSSTTTVPNFAGYTKYTSTATYNGSPLTCTNVSGTFASNGTTPTASSNFDHTHVAQIVGSNALCSTISSSNGTQQALLRLQCYANALYSNNTIRTAMQSSNLCIRDVKANWGSTDPTKFLVDHGPLKSKAEHAAELFTYTGADSGTFRMREDDFRGIQTNDSQVICHLENSTTISVKKRADGHLNLEFVQETHNLDSGVAACRSSESALGVGTMRMLMKMTKI